MYRSASSDTKVSMVVRSLLLLATLALGGSYRCWTDFQS